MCFYTDGVYASFRPHIRIYLYYGYAINIHFRERFLVNYVTHVVQSVFTTYPIPEDDYGEIKHISVNTSRTKSV